MYGKSNRLYFFGKKIFQQEKSIIFVHTNFVMTTIKQNKQLIIALIRTGIGITENLSGFMKGYGLSLPQFNVLRILRGFNGHPANLSTVNERMIHKMSNTTRLIDKLIEKELVERCICEKNRRKIELFITAKGIKLLESIDNAMDAQEEEIVKILTHNEKEELLQLLVKLNQSKINLKK